MNTKEYTHPRLNEPVESISGHYEYIEESTVKAGSRTILYLTGFSITDRSCCGTGGCGFIFIPGYIVKLHHHISDTGEMISTVEPVPAGEKQDEIKQLFQNFELHRQIIFMDE
ncbi:MAG TPA: hypothetical protein VKQ10_00870 [Spirochaetota bacterium]|nr:hypothetical protein [Spirochaetota bacterium]